MDYKALVLGARRTVGDISPRGPIGPLITALCDAVEALERDWERLDWLERIARRDESVEVGWSPAGFESDEYGGNRSSWPGGFFAYSSDMDGLYDHPTLRSAIDAAISHTASSPTPTASVSPASAAPSDA